MSVMQLVREKYKTAIGRADKTDKRPFGSNGSPIHEELKNQFPDVEPHEFPAVTEMLRIQGLREKGIAPDHYTSVTECRHCGPVPIWDGCPPQVLGCPWCLNRVSGSSMPHLVSSASRIAEGYSDDTEDLTREHE